MSKIILLLLSLLLVTTLTAGSIINLAAAQDDDDDDDDDDKNDKNDEEENEENIIDELEEKDEEQHAEESEEWMKQSQENIEAKINQTQMEQEEIKKTLNDLLLGNTSSSPSSSPPVPPVPPVTQKPLNLNCNCTTNNTETFKRTPLLQPLLPPPSVAVEPPLPEPIIIIEEEQIPITTSNIKDFESQGKVTDPNYTNFYTVSNLFDNKIDDVSYWSQAGNSGFYIKLDPTIDDYQVCSMELVNIPNHPTKNTPYVLNVFVSKNYTGVIDSTNETIKFDSCIKNMDQILLIFNPENPTSNDFISIGELRLFGSKLVTEEEEEEEEGEDPTIPKPPKPAPYQNNITKINIENSTAEIDIKNSTVTFKFDPLSAAATFIGGRSN